MTSSKSPHIVFLNQMAGPLFRELAEDISSKWPVGELFTGHPDTLKMSLPDFLRVIPGPMYRRDNYFVRLSSWAHYTVLVFFRYLFSNRKSFVFLVPQPPFLDFMAYLFKRIRKQRYAVLVYDIYPDTLINFGPLRENSLIVKFWRKMNRIAWENAEVVFTIGYKMAENLEGMFDSSKTSAGKVIVIPNWANTDWIKPIPKEENKFAQKYDQVDKLTVMYSGNMGQSHDIETIIAAAKKLKSEESIKFMMLGDGAKKPLVENAKIDHQLDNMTVLGYQSEELLPFSLTTADVALITLDVGCEGLSVPSKTYYSMASGAALVAICDEKAEAAQTIIKHDCGVIVKPGDVDSMVRTILELQEDRGRLERYKRNSRDAAVSFYSRKNTQQYIDVLSAFLE